ncbi:MAG: F0F1 ATP synthase subunit epsilon [Gammaproteobacteria bacterium]
MVIAPGVWGELGIAPNHAPLLTQLMPGPVRLMLKGDREDVFYVSGGMMEVQPRIVTILADTALRADDMDEAAAEKAKAEAIQALTNQRSDIDYAAATLQLAEAVAQLRTLQKIRKSKMLN